MFLGPLLAVFFSFLQMFGVVRPPPWVSTAVYKDGPLYALCVAPSLLLPLSRQCTYTFTIMLGPDKGAYAATVVVFVPALAAAVFQAIQSVSKATHLLSPSLVGTLPPRQALFSAGSAIANSTSSDGNRRTSSDGNRRVSLDNHDHQNAPAPALMSTLRASPPRRVHTARSNVTWIVTVGCYLGVLLGLVHCCATWHTRRRLVDVTSVLAYTGLLYRHRPRYFFRTKYSTKYSAFSRDRHPRHPGVSKMHGISKDGVTLLPWSTIVFIILSIFLAGHRAFSFSSKATPYDTSDGRYTVLERERSFSGFVAVVVDTHRKLKVIKCDHNVLGGVYTAGPHAGAGVAVRTFRGHSGNIQGTFREHSGNIQGTWDYSGNI
jgi:hypothetical protein